MRRAPTLELPFAFIVALLLASTACRSGHVRPALLLPMSQPPRDPSPVRNPVEISAPPPSSETPATRSATRPTRLRRTLEILATIAGSLAGGLPIIEWVGTFEEMRLFGPPRSPPPPPIGSRRRPRSKLRECLRSSQPGPTRVESCRCGADCPAGH